MTDREVKKIYNRVAEDYDQRYRGAEGLYYRLLETDLLFSMLPDIKDKTILDVGTGTGRFVFEFVDRAAKAIGIDISERMIDIATSKVGRKSNVEFYVMDVRSLNFPENYFDMTISAGAFEFIRDLTFFFRKIYRILKPKGQFIFTYFNKKSLFRILPRRRTIEAYSLTDIRDMLEDAGFCLKQARSSFFMPFQLVWGIHSLLKFSALRYIWIKTIILIELLLLKMPFLKYKGMQFVILCEKI